MAQRIIIGVALAGLVTLSAGGGFASAGAAKKPTNAQVVAKAKLVLAPFENTVTAFPVTANLTTVPKGDTIAVMDCGTSVCGLLYSLVDAAAVAAGLTVTHYLSGPTAQETVTAWTAMLASLPSAVITLPASPISIEPYLLQLKTDKIPVVTSGIPWTAAQSTEYGIGAQQVGTRWATITGDLLAAYAVQTHGLKANILFENVPDISFGPAMTADFQREMKILCKTCKVTTINIPIETMGTTDTTQEVAALESHRSINVVASVSSETFYGLPDALSAAGITNVKLVGNAPAPENLADIQAGTEAGGMGFDAPVSAWTDVDAVMRLLEGQPVSKDEADGMGDAEWLNKSTLAPASVHQYTTGWTGYPTFAAMFMKLWGV
jgi:ribose transport system substrate-binding protein